MAQTFVISGVNWTDDALFTTTFIETNPCTGITLDQTTASLQNVGTTLTLTATPTPADTTDPISWESSDETVVTVANGVVTVVGIGTATITATCGEYSATCTVTTRCFMVPNLATVTGVYISGVGAADGSTGLPTFALSTPRGTWIGETGALPLYGATASASDYYPYVLPLNATKIKITADTSLYTAYKLALIDSKTATQPYGSATLIRNLDSSEIPSVSDGYLVEIPTIEGYTIDSIGLSMRRLGADWTDADFANVTVEFLAS